MGALPTGILTFVFTDVEGSTSMIQRLGDDAFANVLAEHNRLIRAAFSGGIEVGTEGDAFFYVFESAEDAITGAVKAQQALAAHPWPEGGAVRVRMGLHTGIGRLGGDNYVGLDLHRASRIAAAGHGGQILISLPTRSEGAGVVGHGVIVRDLGTHFFKDIEEPERVFEVVAPGLAVDHPPIRSLDARPNNLPSQPLDFVGRARQSFEVAELLERSRMVTLTGPGGTGKTRLAVHVASQILGQFDGGVTYVALDSIRTPDLVLPAIGSALRIELDSSTSQLDAIIGALSSRASLLLLDSFEHVLPAAGQIGELLTSTKDLRILVTSQTVLRLRGERAYRVPPLELEEGALLFESRASAADPSFTLNEENRDMVTTLVGRLEALPLAIELAAARVNMFGVTGLLARISQHLDLEGAGFVDSPERHRTLRSAIEWSYDLLSESERALLRHLAIFDGGFVLDAAEYVAPSELAPGVIEGVASLLDKSLLQQRILRGEARFSMLDSIRQFAAEELGPSERERAEERHSEYYAELGERALPLLEGAKQNLWLDRLSAEHDNIRAVVRHCVQTGRPNAGLRCLGNAWRFFHRRGLMVEAISGLGQLLEMPGASDRARAAGLNGVAALRYWQGDYEAAFTTYLEVLDLYRSLGDRYQEAETLYGLSATAYFLGQSDQGEHYADLAEQAYIDAGVPEGVKRLSGARSFAIWMSGDLAAAAQSWAETEAMYAAAGDRGEQLQSQLAQAIVAHQQGLTGQALESLKEILEGMIESEDIAGTVMTLDFMGAVAAGSEPERGVRLAGAAASLREELGGGLTPEAVRLAPAREAAAAALSPEDIDVLWAEGAKMDLDQAVAQARTVTVG